MVLFGKQGYLERYVTIERVISGLFVNLLYAALLDSKDFGRKFDCVVIII